MFIKYVMNQPCCTFLLISQFSQIFCILSNRSRKGHRTTSSVSALHHLLSLRRPEHLGLSLLSLLESCRCRRLREAADKAARCVVALLLENSLDIFYVCSHSMNFWEILRGPLMGIPTTGPSPVQPFTGTCTWSKQVKKKKKYQDWN